MSDRQSADVITRIRSVAVQKLDEKSNHNTPVIFDFGANLEEADRSSESVALNFKMTMDTEPTIAKFAIEGSAMINGEESEIEKLLSPDPETNVPYVFTRIYQTVYSVIFMLAGTIDVPYPSPALLKRPHVKAAYSATAEMPGQAASQ
ncbi:MAG: hypothetical protein JRN20_01425 [Nitrososphaerota archaeon]|nr:hypothetical protein [Nitrososphaerota archaeon]MDG6922024.1 hypothetical protein [Nitrososphaerota archaeon]